jgi:hypothetical protein
MLMRTTMELTRTAIVNGTNGADLKRLIADVAADPADGATRWRVATSWQARRKRCPIRFG